MFNDNNGFEYIGVNNGESRKQDDEPTNLFDHGNHDPH
jgi:hypothetical protein